MQIIHKYGVICEEMNKSFCITNDEGDSFPVRQHKYVVRLCHIKNPEWIDEIVFSRFKHGGVYKWNDSRVGSVKEEHVKKELQRLLKLTDDEVFTFISRYFLGGAYVHSSDY